MGSAVSKTQQSKTQQSPRHEKLGGSGFIAVNLNSSSQDPPNSIPVQPAVQAAAAVQAPRSYATGNSQIRSAMKSDDPKHEENDMNDTNIVPLDGNTCSGGRTSTSFDIRKISNSLSEMSELVELAPHSELIKKSLSQEQRQLRNHNHEHQKQKQHTPRQHHHHPHHREQRQKANSPNSILFGSKRHQTYPPPRQPKTARNTAASKIDHTEQTRTRAKITDGACRCVFPEETTSNIVTLPNKRDENGDPHTASRTRTAAAGSHSLAQAEYATTTDAPYRSTFAEETTSDIAIVTLSNKRDRDGDPNTTNTARTAVTCSSCPIQTLDAAERSAQQPRHLTDEDASNLGDAVLSSSLPLLCSASIAQSMYPDTLEHRLQPDRIMNSSKVITSLFKRAIPRTNRWLFSRAIPEMESRVAKFSPRLPANGPADPDIRRCLEWVSDFIISTIHTTSVLEVDDDMPTLDFLLQFLLALFRVQQMETPCGVLLYIYLNRLQTSGTVYLNVGNWRSVLVGACLLSTKFLDDFSTKNLDFAIVLSEYGIKDINRLEAAFLIAIDWRLHVTRTEYTKYFFVLSGRRTKRSSCII